MSDEEVEDILNKLKRATLLQEISENRELNLAEATELKALEREILANAILDGADSGQFQ
jgi:hypothetical protein